MLLDPSKILKVNINKAIFFYVFLLTLKPLLALYSIIYKEMNF